MRITKAMLREAKTKLIRQVRELNNASEKEVRRLWHERYPHRDSRLTPAFWEAMRKELLQDAVDSAIPDHWVD